MEIMSLLILTMKFTRRKELDIKHFKRIKALNVKAHRNLKANFLIRLSWSRRLHPHNVLKVKTLHYMLFSLFLIVRVSLFSDYKCQLNLNQYLPILFSPSSTLALSIHHSLLYIHILNLSKKVCLIMNPQVKERNCSSSCKAFWYTYFLKNWWGATLFLVSAVWVCPIGVSLSSLWR